MTWFQGWFLRRVFTQEVMQGYDHDKRIRELYAMIRRAARDEFVEDSQLTLNSFLKEQFDATQW